MRIFLSYASEDADVAKEIQLALTAAGHTVFFDRTALPAGGDYNAHIRKAVEDSDGMVFLISPHSVDQGSYALTELNFAEKKWSHPKGRVLPVVVGRVDFESIPAYPKAVTILEPEGNVAAEIAATVEHTWGKSRNRNKIIVGTAVLALALVLTLTFTLIRSLFLDERADQPKSPLLSGDVLIARFDARHAAKTYEIANRLKDNLEKQLSANSMDDVVVKMAPNPLESQEQADSLASAGKFKVVIWGWYDDLSINLRLFLSGGEVPGGKLGEIPWELADEPNEEIRMIVREVLPENTSFLSLFVIGHLYYQANDYQAGHNAFNAAMNSIPENVELQNEAVQHFFHARQKHARITANVPSNSDDIIDAVCGYAKAIKHDPTLAAAYNNMGVILSDFTLDAASPAVQCLADAGFTANARKFFKKALSLQPELVVFKYNALAHDWKIQGISEFEVEENPFKPRLEQIIRQDPSIPGPYMMLGVIAFDNNDLETASRHFSKALSLVSGPVSAQLYVNTGQTQLRTKAYKSAEEAFQTALSIDPDDGEAHLALAALALKNNNPDSALTHIEAIPSLETAPDTLAKTAAIILSRVHLERDNTALAIETLEQLVSGDHIPDLDIAHYLLGLLHTLNGNTDAAAERWTHKFWEPLDAIIEDRRNITAKLAWNDLYLSCSLTSEKVPVAQWGEQGDCLPSNVRARIDAVYAHIEHWLAYRIYFRNNVLLAGLACPFVFTYDDAQQVWRQDTVILYKLVGQSDEAIQRRPLKRFDGRLMIRELEPEISYIDQLHVLAVDESGEQTTLEAQVGALQNADNQYVILNPGDEILLDFTGFKLTNHPQHYWVVAKGYYIPILSKYSGDDG